jgi:HPt (histidine-containing phosphotransfer) domain-containing protein
MRAAHTLKSSCASLGAQHISDLCRTLEGQAREMLEKDQNPDDFRLSQFKQEVEDIKVEFEQVCIALDLMRRDF